MNREEQLERENQVLKERLYACHALGIPEVTAALAPHLDLMGLDVYAHRAQLQGTVTQMGTALRESEATIRAMDSSLRSITERAERLHAIVLDFWRQLGHDIEKEPVPGLED